LRLILPKKCKQENLTAAEEKRALERRRQAIEESKANRQNELEGAAPDEDHNALERLLDTLRNGDTITRKARRRRPGSEKNSTATANLTLDVLAPGNDTTLTARDMLARLQSDGFVPPPSPTVSTHQRRRRRRIERAPQNEKEILNSPLATEILDIEELIEEREEEHPTAPP
jgi:cytokinesis protein